VHANCTRLKPIPHLNNIYFTTSTFSSWLEANATKTGLRLAKFSRSPLVDTLLGLINVVANTQENAITFVHCVAVPLITRMLLQWLELALLVLNSHERLLLFFLFFFACCVNFSSYDQQS
jgi:hypothetical protein